MKSALAASARGAGGSLVTTTESIVARYYTAGLFSQHAARGICGGLRAYTGIALQSRT